MLLYNRCAKCSIEAINCTDVAFILYTSFEFFFCPLFCDKIGQFHPFFPHPLIELNSIHISLVVSAIHCLSSSTDIHLAVYRKYIVRFLM